MREAGSKWDIKATEYDGIKGDIRDIPTTRSDVSDRQLCFRGAGCRDIGDHVSYGAPRHTKKQYWK
eukprot:5125837-Pleurochrysis_carterae.AAC.1